MLSPINNYLYYYTDATEQCDSDADLCQASGSSSPVLHTVLLSQPQRVSTVRLKRPPLVIHKRRTRRRISDDEIGFREASADHVQDEQGAEDVRHTSAVMDKMNRVLWV